MKSSLDKTSTLVPIINHDGIGLVGFYFLKWSTLVNTHWSTVLTGSMGLDWVAKGEKGIEGEVKAHGDKERFSIPPGN